MRKIVVAELEAAADAVARRARVPRDDSDTGRYADRVASSSLMSSPGLHQGAARTT